jgi:hypothetical protein
MNFYKQLYSEQYMWRPKVDVLSFLSIKGRGGREGGVKCWRVEKFQWR